MPYPKDLIESLSADDLLACQILYGQCYRHHVTPDVAARAYLPQPHVLTDPQRALVEWMLSRPHEEICWQGHPHAQFLNGYLR